MKKRLTTAFALCAFVAAMLPGVATADWVLTPENTLDCPTTLVSDPSTFGGWRSYYRSLGNCGPVRVVHVSA